MSERTLVFRCDCKEYCRGLQGDVSRGTWYKHREFHAPNSRASIRTVDVDGHEVVARIRRRNKARVRKTQQEALGMIAKILTWIMLIEVLTKTILVQK